MKLPVYVGTGSLRHLRTAQNWVKHENRFRNNTFRTTEADAI